MDSKIFNMNFKFLTRAILKLQNRKLFSFSKLGSYVTCPKKYRYRYIDKVKEEEDSKGYAVLGTLVHDCFEMLVEGEDRHAVLDYFHYKFNKFVEKGLTIKGDIDTYRDSCAHFIDQCEIPTGKQFRVEYRCIGRIGKGYMEGYIDLLEFIDKNEDGTWNVVITDVKTSLVYAGEEKRKYGEQLKVYAYLIEQEFPNVKVQKLQWLHTKQALVSFLGGDKPTKPARKMRNDLFSSYDKRIMKYCIDKGIYTYEELLELGIEPVTEEAIQIYHEHLKGLNEEITEENEEIEIHNKSLGDVKKGKKRKKALHEIQSFEDTQLYLGLKELTTKMYMENKLPKKLAKVFVVTDCYVEFESPEEWDFIRMVNDFDRVMQMIYYDKDYTKETKDFQSCANCGYEKLCKGGAKDKVDNTKKLYGDIDLSDVF